MYGNNFGYPFMGGMPSQIVPPEFCSDIVF